MDERVRMEGNMAKVRMARKEENSERTEVSSVKRVESLEKVKVNDLVHTLIKVIRKVRMCTLWDCQRI